MPPPNPLKKNKKKEVWLEQRSRKENDWVRSPEMPCEEGRQCRAALGEGS